jgi:hypothetical protein
MVINQKKMQVQVTKRDLKAGRGLEIHIPGVLGNPADAGLTCPIYIEYHNGRVQVHVWDGKQDPTTTVLTNRRAG